MFNNLVLTNNGIALLSALLSGDTIEFTKIKMGDNPTAPGSIATLTDVLSIKQTLNVARSKIINNNSVNIGANLMGSDVTTDFDWREVGIFAKNITAGTSEILFSYQYATTAVPIPSGGTVAEMLLDFIIAVGNASNVNITLDESLIFITQEDLTALHNTITSETGTAIAASETAVNATIITHIDNKSNPHEVTKAQVGLGNVVNQASATEAEARAGTASNKNMTPQRVRQSMESFGVISDGNLIIKVGGSQPSPQSGKTIIWIEPPTS